MLRAISVAAPGAWPLAKLADTVKLDYESRYRRRIMLECQTLGPVLLDLPEAAALEDGDGLLLSDGAWLRVIAAEEPLLEVQLDSAQMLARVAWHLGNHHCAAQILPDRIRIRRDHVLENMLRGLGCEPISACAPFQPEKGAYHASRRSQHSH